MKIAVGADHAGFEAKEAVKRYLAARGHDVDDVGTHGTASVDYPDFAAQVARKVARGEAAFGVLVCGSGVGMSITANKIPGVRAAHCSDPYTARLSRQHNDANVLCVGSRVTGSGMLEDILQAFLDASFEGGRHARRLDKIARLEGGSEGDPRCGC